MDWFTLPDGRLLHPYRITQEVFAKRSVPVRQFQVVQEAPDRIVLRMVVPPSAPLDAIGEAEAAVRAMLGPSVAFSSEIVPEIRPEANGKYRLFHPAVSGGAPETGGRA
jgi:hypothetical protein